jgi:hypothetical protein
MSLRGQPPPGSAGRTLMPPPADGPFAERLAGAALRSQSSDTAEASGASCPLRQTVPSATGLLRGLRILLAEHRFVLDLQGRGQGLRDVARLG